MRQNFKLPHNHRLHDEVIPKIDHRESKGQCLGNNLCNCHDDKLDEYNFKAKEGTYIGMM
jgi:hypothetical protein